MHKCIYEPAQKGENVKYVKKKEEKKQEREKEKREREKVNQVTIVRYICIDTQLKRNISITNQYLWCRRHTESHVCGWTPSASPCS